MLFLFAEFSVLFLHFVVEVSCAWFVSYFSSNIFTVQGLLPFHNYPCSHCSVFPVFVLYCVNQLCLVRVLLFLKYFCFNCHSGSSFFCVLLSKSVAWFVPCSYQIFPLSLLPRVFLLLKIIFTATVQCLPSFVLLCGIQLLDLYSTLLKYFHFY